MFVEYIKSFYNVKENGSEILKTKTHGGKINKSDNARLYDSLIDNKKILKGTKKNNLTGKITREYWEIREDLFKNL